MEVDHLKLASWSHLQCSEGNICALLVLYFGISKSKPVLLLHRQKFKSLRETSGEVQVALKKKGTYRLRLDKRAKRLWVKKSNYG